MSALYDAPTSSALVAAAIQWPAHLAEPEQKLVLNCVKMGLTTATSCDKTAGLANYHPTVLGGGARPAQRQRQFVVTCISGDVAKELGATMLYDQA